VICGRDVRQRDPAIFYLPIPLASIRAVVPVFAGRPFLNKFL